MENKKLNSTIYYLQNWAYTLFTKFECNFHMNLKHQYQDKKNETYSIHLKKLSKNK